jgi:hypothetical protein
MVTIRTASHLLRNTRKTDRDPLRPIVSFWFVWRRGIAAFALIMPTHIRSTDSSVYMGEIGVLPAREPA